MVLQLSKSGKDNKNYLSAKKNMHPQYFQLITYYLRNTLRM